MVASVDAIASKAGADVMRRGGNAVDAAVTVALTLAVTWPEAGNLGGGGFMLVRKADGTAEMVDYRETAPAAASRTMYLDANGNVTNDSTLGYRASGIPGTVAGLALAHKRYGKLPWKSLVEPARKLAAEGFIVSQYVERSLRTTEAQRMKQFPASWKTYGGLKAGDRLVQPELARTLARLANDPSDFYRGETARKIAAAMKAHDGLITAADLAGYKALIRQPLHGTYRGYEIVTVPPPSSGGVALIEMLNILEAYDLKSMGWHSSQEVHTVLEAMRRAYGDRAKFLGDPDFARIPVAGLISKRYAEERRKDIDPAKASDSRSSGAGDPARYESPSTTHFTVVDQEGMIVSNTYTMNDSYGSAVSIAGFLMNDEMDDYTSPARARTWCVASSRSGALGHSSRTAEERSLDERPRSSVGPTRLMLAHCQNRECSAVASSVLVNSGVWPSIAIGKDDLPIVTWRSLLRPEMLLIHCNDPDCALRESTSVPANLIAEIRIGGDGVPFIVSDDVDGRKIHLTRCTNPLCTASVSTVIQIRESSAQR